MAKNKNWISDFGSSLLEHYVTNIPGIGMILKAFGVGSMVKGAAQDALSSNEFQSWVADKTQSDATGRDTALNQMNLQNLHDQYQYNVQGMKDAGLNPALMYQNSGSSAPSVSNGGSAGSLSTLLSLAMLPAQLRLMKAQTKSVEAGTEKTKAETESTALSNAWIDRLNKAEIDSKRSNIDLNKSRIREIDSSIDELAARTNKELEEAKTEGAKRDLMLTQRLLNEANAYRVNALVPFERNLMAAKTDAEKSSAEFALAQAAYTNGLLTSGILEFSASKAQSEAIIAAFESRITDPSSSPYNGATRIPQEIISAIHNIVTYCNPLKLGK